MSSGREDLAESMDFAKREADPDGFYAALGLLPTADPRAIRQAFLTLSQAYHTDKHVQADADVQELMSQRFQKVQQANEVLSDPRQRAAYNHSGTKGVSRLALVPQTVTLQADVQKHLSWLEREAELRTVARQLGSRSSMTATFLWASIFASRPLVDRRAASMAQQQKQPPRADVEAEMTASESPQPPTSEPPGEAPQGQLESQEQQQEQQQPPQEEGQGQSPSGSAASAAGPSSSPGSRPSALTPQPVAATIAKAIVDGQEVYVAILPENIQAMLAAKGGIPADAPTATLTSAPIDTSSSSPMQQQQNGQQQRGRPSLLGMLCTPSSLQLQHSFYHDVSARVGLTLKALASNTAGRATTSLSVACTFVASCVNTLELAVTVGVQQLELAVKQTRKLSNIWTLKSKLSLLEDGVVLNQLRITLSRAIAMQTELVNTVCWSLVGHGFFQTIVATTTSAGGRGFVTRIAPNSLVFTLFQQRNIALADATQPSYRVQQNLTCDSLSGRSECGYEVWYMPNKLVRYGLGISAALPIAFCPLAPPLFLSMHHQYVSITTIKLLYARGEHQIQIPIVISASQWLSTGLMLLCAPWALYRIGRVVLKPLLDVQAARQMVLQRQQLKPEVEANRQKALREQAAIEQTAMRRRAVEDSVKGGGLVIINAKYGIVNPRMPSLASPYPLTLDVTIPLQHFVSDSKLLLPEGPKRGLVGFYDVDPATAADPRQLRILYWFRGSKHEVTLEEHDAVTLPLVEHLSRQQ